ncbi:DNA-binding protein HU-alpha [Polynucleobacter sp. SHI8]|uniref:HU family DNA-binding protein n=1 Tax=unclassified Polynucleobacter TaxID=2640945 RepID=UPI0024915318|nr:MULTISPECIES: HU family DNA-binding protein [unclassified Polynucleobacter]BDW12001.1 DNA-binding protein HU-alpha [Polynucleobacter sp. SHI2]BDW14449.1 DNA-binding protein HU-alpha [Polynucleobacter sp. SHI8]
MMNKKDLAEAIALGADISQTKGEEVLKILLEIIEKQLISHESVQLSGFGTFAVKTRSARVGRNPKTGDPIEIGSSIAIRFIPGKAFKEQVNQPIN